MAETMRTIKRVTPRADEVLFLPLGGCNEIGMNLNLYGHAGEWLMVDCGVAFANGAVAGVDVLMPDISFASWHKKRLSGLVLTHAHEDHLGAVAYLWRQLGCAIYGTSFTLSVLRHKLTEAGIVGEVLLHEIGSERFSVGCFDIEMLGLTHSIPESQALVIRTGAGTILHSGDWKFDASPVVGEVSDEASLRRVGDEGVLAFMCDSTNVFLEGSSESEGVVGENLACLLGDLSERVFVTCFASNIARLRSLFAAAESCGREVVLAGSALHRMVSYAQDSGYLAADLRFHDAELGGDFSGDRFLVLLTGSQGEPFAALSRVVRGEHPHLRLRAGDTVIFSSRVIPGNELSVSYLQNRLVSEGVSVIGEEFGDYGALHASGHPHRDELARMYQLVRPRIAVPVHGEARHLREHVALASSFQVPHSYMVRNGEILRFSESGVESVDSLELEPLCFDGDLLSPLSERHLSDRRKLASEGIVFCSVVLSKKRAKKLGADAIRVTCRGLAPEFLSARGDAEEFLCDIAERALSRVGSGSVRDISEAVRIALRREIRKRSGKNSQVVVHILESL